LEDWGSTIELHPRAAGMDPGLRGTTVLPTRAVSETVTDWVHRRGMAQVGSAAALGAEGRRFESGYPDPLPSGDLWVSGCPVAGADRAEYAGPTGALPCRWVHPWTRTSTTRFWSAATVKSAVETLSPTRVKLSVEVTSEELAPRMDAAYKTIGQQVNVPGFRRGKVPNRVIDQRFGRGTVVPGAVNDALGEDYAQAMAETD